MHKISKEEQKFIKDNVFKMGIRWCAEQLHRSINTVYNYKKQLLKDDEIEGKQRNEYLKNHVRIFSDLEEAVKYANENNECLVREYSWRPAYKGMPEQHEYEAICGRSKDFPRNRVRCCLWTKYDVYYHCNPHTKKWIKTPDDNGK